MPRAPIVPMPTRLPWLSRLGRALRSLAEILAFGAGLAAMLVLVHLVGALAERAP